MLQELTSHLMRSYADGSGMRNIGLECELPLVDANTMHAPSLGVAQSMLQAFADDGFELIRDAQTGAVVRTQRHVQSRTYAPVCDVVELELGYPTIEVSTAPEPTIKDAVERMRRLLRPLAARAAEASCAVLGYGMQPFTPPSRALRAPKGRYRLYDAYATHRWIPPETGSDVDLFTVTASCQCHVQVSRDEAVPALNALNRLAGPLMALAANSCFWKGQRDPAWSVPRERFYDMVYAENPRFPVQTFGIPGDFDSLEGYTAHILAMQALMVARDDGYVALADPITVANYFGVSNALVARSVAGQSLMLEPHIDDIFTFSSFIEFCARLSPRYGTIEARMFCQQPPNEFGCVPALVLGLIENLADAERISRLVTIEEAQALRSAAQAHALRAGDPCLRLCELVVAAADKGLRRRGLHEEEFLEPLRRRLRDGIGAGDAAAREFEVGGREALLRCVAYT